MRHLLVHAKSFARIEDRLKPFADHISPLVLSDEGDLKQAWGESEATGLVAYGTQDAYFSPSVITFFQTLLSHERLEWFQSSAAGTEHPMIQATGKKAERFTDSHEQAHAIAEWISWAGLDFFQRGPKRRAAQTAQTWSRLPSREISSTHWVIIGFGAIGVAAAQRLKALGATVTGVRRSGGASEHADEIITPGALPAALRSADAVLMCVPLTPETEHLANQSFFTAMKPDALFMNVGRGGSVDETALIQALDAGELAYASLDVAQEEPYPRDGPLWSHPKVALTAHISALTAESARRTDLIFLENLRRFLENEPLQNLVESKVFS